MRSNPLPGGPEIVEDLSTIIDEVQDNRGTPFELHRNFELLHPFTDGNGRAGRLLWAWQMLHHGIEPGICLGFLHAWYYQSLEVAR